MKVTDISQQRGLPLRIVIGHSQVVFRPLRITGLAGAFALFDTVGQGLRLTS